jgi:hypothetical protein
MNVAALQGPISGSALFLSPPAGGPASDNACVRIRARRQIGTGARPIIVTRPARSARRRKPQTVSRSRPMKRSTLLVAAFLAAGLSVAALGIRAAVDTPRTLMSPDIHQQLKREVEASTRLALGKCREVTGIERDVCKAEARAAERVALADLSARYHGTHAAWKRRPSVRAKASFDVAKARCGAKTADARVECLKQARDERNRMLAESRPTAPRSCT